MRECAKLSFQAGQLLSLVCEMHAGQGQKGMSSSEISVDWAKSSWVAGGRWSKLAVEPELRLYPPELPLSSRPERRERSLTMISVR